MLLGDILREQARVKLAMRRPEPVKRDDGRDDDAFLRRRHAPTPTPAKAVPRIVMQAQAMAVLLILLSPSHIASPTVPIEVLP